MRAAADCQRVPRRPTVPHGGHAARRREARAEHEAKTTWRASRSREAAQSRAGSDGPSTRPDQPLRGLGEP